MIIYNLTLRQLLSGRRWLTLLALAAVPIVLSAIDVSSGDETVFLDAGFPDIVVAIIVPLIPLLLAGSALASDIEEGTAVYVLAKPVSRTRILLEKFFAIITVALVTSLATTVISLGLQAARVEGFASFLTAYVAAVSVGTIAYSAIFLALSLITRRGIIIGLLYILVWETILAGQFAGTRTLSVKEYMISLASALDKSGHAEQVTSVSVTTALVMAAILSTVSVVLALRRLRSFEVTEQG